MRSEASTAKQYLEELPEDRRAAIEAVRQVILDNLPKGCEEAMKWGMIAYQVPLETFPDTNNRQPLMYAALASQKHHMAVYLSSIYMDDEVKKEFKAAICFTEEKKGRGKKEKKGRISDYNLNFVQQFVFFCFDNFSPFRRDELTAG